MVVEVRWGGDRDGEEEELGGEGEGEEGGVREVEGEG